MAGNRPFTSLLRGLPFVLRESDGMDLTSIPAPSLATSMRCNAFQRPQFHLSDDLLDDIILCETYGVYGELFFPKEAREIPSGDYILDVGTHHGVYTVAALYEYPKSRIIAVEPDPQAAGVLRDNIRLNKAFDRVEVVEAAIAAHEGQGLLEQSPTGSWGNSLIKDQKIGVSTVQVRTTRLDMILQGRKPYLVKCNAEGGEYELIPQLFELGMFPAVIILLLHAWAGSPDDLIRLVESQGYRMKPVMSTPEQPRFVCVR